jgi:hypothetical protein
VAARPCRSTRIAAAVAVAKPFHLLDERIGGFGGSVGHAAGIEVGEQFLAPGVKGAGQSDQLGDLVCGDEGEQGQQSPLGAFYGSLGTRSRLHLVCTLHGLPVGWALTGAKADERLVLADILTTTPALAHSRPGRQIVLADKNYYGKVLEADLANAHIDLLRPTRKGETRRPGEQFFKPLRQVIESINDTLKGQLDLERHGGRTIAGVCASPNASLALTAAIWHNDHLGTASTGR